MRIRQLSPSPNRHGRRWTPEEQQYLSDYICTLTPRYIASRLGRSPYAILRYAWDHHLAPCSVDMWTSGQVAEITGKSQQYLTRLARSRRVRARRKPAGRWWLFDPEDVKEFFGMPRTPNISPLRIEESACSAEARVDGVSLESTYKRHQRKWKERNDGRD